MPIVHYMPLGLFSDCNEEEFMCHEESRCLPKEWLCDGEVECEGGQDEEDCGKYMEMRMSESNFMMISTVLINFICCSESLSYFLIYETP